MRNLSTDGAIFGMKVVNKEDGMALVTVLVFSSVAMLVVTLAISMGILSSMSSRQMIQGLEAKSVAESGVENALLRLLRDPTYIGETLTMDNGTATIVVSGSSPKIISVEGRVGTVVKKIDATVSDTNGVMTIESWQEVY